jgi:hypothetical protein
MVMSSSPHPAALLHPGTGDFQIAVVLATSYDRRFGNRRSADEARQTPYSLSFNERRGVNGEWDFAAPHASGQ